MGVGGTHSLGPWHTSFHRAVDDNDECRPYCWLGSLLQIPYLVNGIRKLSKLENAYGDLIHWCALLGYYSTYCNETSYSP